MYTLQTSLASGSKAGPVSTFFEVEVTNAPDALYLLRELRSLPLVSGVLEIVSNASLRA